MSVLIQKVEIFGALNYLTLQFDIWKIRTCSYACDNATTIHLAT